MTTSPLSASVPSEPPDGSVVLDAKDHAWQRVGAVWVIAAGGLALMTAQHWAALLINHGPVRPIWQPRPEPADEPAPTDDEDIDELPDESLIVHIVEAAEVEGVLHLAATDQIARDWITDYGEPAYPGLALTVTAREVDHG